MKLDAHQSAPPALLARLPLRYHLITGLIFLTASSGGWAQSTRVPTSPALGMARVTTLGDAYARSATAVPGCPNQGGLLNSITVPVDRPLNLSVSLSTPAPAGGAAFRVSSDNPAFVAAGDRRQGFTPIVNVPAGATVSNAFTIFGIAVGQTVLRLTPLSSGFAVSTTPLGAWDINRSGSGADQKFVDVNQGSTICRAANSPNLATGAAVLGTCGKPIKAVASDGVSELLLRTVAGLQGTACFEIVSSGADEQGQVATPLTGTQSASGLNYGFSKYTPPTFFGAAGGNSRPLEVEFTFTPSIGNGNTTRLRAKLDIVRPPVVLVHGLWSDGATWADNFLRDDAFHTTVAADYAGTSAADFGANAARVRTAVSEAVTLARRKQHAVTQTDVVGHSMGGLLARLFVDATNFKRPDNFDKGDVHRLVTLDTPHWGSSFANLLVSLHNVDTRTADQLETTVGDLTGGSVRAGAVCDLAENSVGLSALTAGTSLPGQVITATGGPAGSVATPAPYWGGATVFNARSFEAALTSTWCARWEFQLGIPPRVCADRRLNFPKNIVDAWRFREANDAVVSQTSQSGGLSGTNYAEYLHFKIGVVGARRGVTEGADVATRTFELLDGPASGLAARFPAVPSSGLGGPLSVGMGTATAQTDYAAQCGPGGPMKNRGGNLTQTTSRFVNSNVRIISPLPSTRFNRGGSITAVLELQPPLTAANTVEVAFAGHGRVEAEWNGGLRFTAVLPSSALAEGSMVLTPYITDEQGRTSAGAPIEVVVTPEASLVAMTLQLSTIVLQPAGQPRQIYVSGTYADGSRMDISSAATGTIYTSTSPGVLTVSADGLLTPLQAGSAAVNLRNAQQTVQLNVRVEDPASPLPPTSLGSAVTFTRSGIRLDRSSGLYVQEVSFKHNAAAPFVGPLVLVIRSLTAGVTAVGKSGLTQAITPLGSPYYLLDLPQNGLVWAPNSPLRLTLRFLNPDRLPLDYALEVIATQATP